MKAIIFAGGSGTRLWPLSRRASPKQFEKVIGDKSTLQLAVERLLPDFSPKDIYIFTGAAYVDTVRRQIPEVPKGQVIGEPEMRDVGPAVGLALAILTKENPKEPIAILWSDHIVRDEKRFRQILVTAATVIRKNPMRIVFIGQKPRFASQNLGWIEYGNQVKKVNGVSLYQFKSFHYRPKLDQAKQFLKSGHHVWNIGYFVTTASFLWQQYEALVPKMHETLKPIQRAWQSRQFGQVLQEYYPKLEKIHFDNAILVKLDPKYGLVIADDLKWSDVGAWEALKEALQEHPEQNVVQGRVLTTDCRDSLVYNYTDQLVVAIDLAGLLVVNTHDVLLVCHKDSVPKIKRLVEELAGSENKHLI